MQGGDLLFAKAAELAADLGGEALRIQADTARRLVRGQFKETTGPNPGEDPVDHYHAVVADKTGSLIAAAAHLGALLSGADSEIVATLARFGEVIGTTFQLADDLLDVDGDVRLSGKSAGTDLRQGVETLPTMYVRARARKQDARLLALLDGDLSDEARLGEAIGLIRVHPGMEQARREVRQSAIKAGKLLSRLPAVPARSALETACTAVVQRCG